MEERREEAGKQMRPSPGLWSPQLYGPGRGGKETGSERGEK